MRMNATHPLPWRENEEAKRCNNWTNATQSMTEVGVAFKAATL